MIVAALIAGMLSGGGIIWKVQAWRYDSMELKRQADATQKVRDDIKRIDRAAEGFEAGQADAGIHEVETQKEVIRVVTKPVYLERCLDDDGLRIITSDIDAANNRRGLAASVPTDPKAK